MVRPRNREQVIKNMKGIKKVLDTQKAEVYFLQEVDLDSSRSYRIDQHRYFEKALEYQVFLPGTINAILSPIRSLPWER